MRASLVLPSYAPPFRFVSYGRLNLLELITCCCLRYPIAKHTVRNILNRTEAGLVSIILLDSAHLIVVGSPIPLQCSRFINMMQVESCTKKMSDVAD